MSLLLGQTVQLLIRTARNPLALVVALETRIRRVRHAFHTFNNEKCCCIILYSRCKHLGDCYFLLLRYETRLKDVVRAYKGLSKENEALKTSLNAITEATEEVMK